MTQQARWDIFQQDSMIHGTRSVTNLMDYGAQAKISSPREVTIMPCHVRSSTCANMSIFVEIEM